MQLKFEKKTHLSSTKKDSAFEIRGSNVTIPSVDPVPIFHRCLRQLYHFPWRQTHG